MHSLFNLDASVGSVGFLRGLLLVVVLLLDLLPPSLAILLSLCTSKSMSATPASLKGNTYLTSVEKYQLDSNGQAHM